MALLFKWHICRAAICERVTITGRTTAEKSTRSYLWVNINLAYIAPFQAHGDTTS